jgi:FSR family fosmidomycin resistance protein-like MFS transporter
MLASCLIEPVLGILADTWRRRALVLAGGACFAGAAALTSISQGFGMLLLSFLLFYPASGAFVSISQATLMDSSPRRREQNMARWTFAGSIGMAAGPLALAAATALGLGWRWLFAGAAGLAASCTLLARRYPFDARRLKRARGVERVSRGERSSGIARNRGGASIRSGLLGAMRALKRPSVLRWLALLQASDLMLDVLFGYLALYFVEAAGFSVTQAALAVTVWTVVGLAGDFLLIPLLERVEGLAYLRLSAAAMALLFPGFLLARALPLKLALLGAMGLLNSGWYAILKARFYAALPGRAGAAMAVSNLAGVAGSLVPIALGLVAEAAGLGAAMWLLLAGPLALLFGLPRTGLLRSSGSRSAPRARG